MSAHSDHSLPSAGSVLALQEGCWKFGGGVWRGNGQRRVGVEMRKKLSAVQEGRCSRIVLTRWGWVAGWTATGWCGRAFAAQRLRLVL